MAETAEFRSDIGNRDRNLGKYCTAGYFLELSELLTKKGFRIIRRIFFITHKFEAYFVSTVDFFA